MTKKFKPFKDQKIIWKKDSGLEHSVKISLDCGKLLITTNAESYIKGESWGCGWGSSFEPEQFEALMSMLHFVVVEES